MKQLKLLKIFSNKSNKKSMELWLSWVILVAFTIGMGALLTTWMFEYSDSTSESIKEVVYNEGDCNHASFTINDICNTTSSTDINITNKGTLNIDAIIFRFYTDEGANNVVNIRYNLTDENITFKPGRTRQISVTEYTGNIYILDGVPILYKGDLEIVCQNRKATNNQISCS